MAGRAGSEINAAWVVLGTIAALGTLVLSLDGLHYWHDVRFLFATTQFPFSEVMGGSFNPHQSWASIDESGAAGFYTAKILHLWLLNRLFALVPPPLGGLDVAIGLSVAIMAAAAAGGGFLIGRVTGSRNLGWAGLVCFLLVPLTPYLAGKQLAEVTSLALTAWGLVLAWGALQAKGSRPAWIEALPAGVVLLLAALCRLDSLFGALAFFLSSWLLASEPAARRRVVRVSGAVLGVVALGYGITMALVGTSVSDYARYLSGVIAAPNRPISMSILSVATFGGVLYLVAALAVFSRRRRLAGFFLLWWVLAWLPSVSITAAYMIEPRYLVQGLLPLAGLAALGLEAIGQRMPSGRAVAIGGATLLLVLPSNWLTIRLMPYELDRPAILKAVDDIESRSPGAAILVPWAYTDFNFLYVMRPSASIYSVHSPTELDVPAELVEAWHARYRSWYGQRHLSDASALGELLEDGPVYFLGWHRYPPLAFVERAAARFGLRALVERLRGIELLDHLETSWVRSAPGLTFELSGRVGQYESYRVVASPEFEAWAARASVTVLDSPAVEFSLPIPPEDDETGGLITYDLDGDAQLDFLVTRPGLVTAVSAKGQALWQHEIDVQVGKQSETHGLPGWHGPGIQAADIEGDGRSEVLYLTRSSHLYVVDGATGEVRRRVALRAPEGAERWEHLVVADFRGLGDRDLLLQATNAEGYRMGRYVAAFALEELMRADSPEALWIRDDFRAAAHNGARVADLDGDGRDEVIGGDIVRWDGQKLFELPAGGHIDAVAIADVRPDLPGLEVVALEEGGEDRSIGRDDALPEHEGADARAWVGNRVFLFGTGGLIWEADHHGAEAQNTAVGDFIPGRAGLEIWCRSRYEVDQKPFAFDAYGALVAAYELKPWAPSDWTPKGVEVLHAIEWTGDEMTMVAAKARHESGDVAVIDAITGRFVVRIPESADRLYVADVVGDWREEVVVLAGNRLRVYANPDPNPRPDKASLWSQPHYRRNKQTWNYYST